MLRLPCHFAVAALVALVFGIAAACIGVAGPVFAAVHTEQTVAVHMDLPVVRQPVPCKCHLRNLNMSLGTEA